MLEPTIKLNINNISFNVVLISLFLTASISASAITENTEKETHIYISSDRQSLNLQENVIIFTGNVLLSKGKMKISADKVVVTRTDGEQGKEIINCYGTPATFYQMLDQDNGKYIKCKAFNMRYDLDKEFIVMTGNSYLEQLDSKITGDQIIYLIKEKKMQAFQKNGKRVQTVLIPLQLQQELNKTKKIHTNIE